MPLFCQILRLSWQWSYCDATRALGDVTAMSRGTWRAPSYPTARLLQCYGDLFPRRPHCTCFEHVQNLAATSATLETLLRSAALPRHSMSSRKDPAAISGNLADFADRSEVAVLCDWGINNLFKLTSKKASSPAVISIWEGNAPVGRQHGKHFHVMQSSWQTLACIKVSSLLFEPLLMLYFQLDI